MADPEQHPQIYLISPPDIALGSFPATLGRVLDTAPVACLRLDLTSREEDTLARAADACRDIAHARDVAIVISDHLVLAERLGLDGVHLTGHGSVRAARKALGPDAIVGSFCGTSRHDGITAGEAGADYVSFGPVSGTLGDGSLAEDELFAWWSEMIELPVVAEGGLDPDAVARLAPVTDFFGIGDEIWRADDPAAALGALIAAMG
jgi:thiamine-phosphate pyrophosphorylase